ncbi:MAG: diguanylate cyclase [Proteobacteria bacterium]|nr:diguanylate cyclase [Pseudomonadota bacterium]MBU2620382.1 diguanylate cyclase [Pseudomonadota bacterium]
MEAIRKAILACMQNCTPDDDLVASLKGIVEQEGIQACRIIMEMVAHRDFESEEAARHWDKIQIHQAELSALLARPVSLPVAVCDYLHWVEKTIGYPKLIDVNKFEELFTQARRDFLTGLYNRQEFEEAISREIARGKRHERKVSLLFIDLDSFKMLNDQYGHLAGDSALQHLARIIGESKRLEDMVARYGGDEFVMLLPDTSKEEALRFAERFRKMVESNKAIYNSHFLSITISGGVATFPDDAQEVVKLIQFADHALNVAKRQGKNVVLGYKKEARKFLRLPYVEKVRGTALSGKQNIVLRAESKNLGSGGILLENTFPVHVGSSVEISIVLDGRTVTVLGEVVRTDQLATDRFAIGVSFLEKQESTKIVLDRYVLNSLMQSTRAYQ